MHGQLEMGYGISVKAISDVRWVDPETKVHHGSKNTSFRVSLLPRVCRYSNNLIWFKRGYRVRHTYYGYNGESTHEDRWYDKNSYLMLRLKA